MDENRQSKLIMIVAAALVEQHAIYYQQHWGFGLDLEDKVASGLAAFLEELGGISWSQ